MPTSFALHKAIWDGDIVQVEDILHQACAGIEKGTEPAILQERDAQGNTPLMLALRCVHPSQHPIIQVLLKYGANVHTRDRDGWTCIQNATLCDNDDILTDIFIHAEKRTYELLRARSMVLHETLKNIPDFYVEIKIELTSWVPLVSRALPSDTLKIWKQGCNIRCDFSIKDLHNTTWKRGRMTHLLQTFPDQPGHVWLLDHDLKTANDISKFMENPSKTDIDTSLEMLYTCKLSTYNMNVSKMTLKPKKEVFKKKETISSGKKYEIQNANVKLRLRGAAQPHWAPDGITLPKDTKLAKAKKFFSHLTPTKSTPKSNTPSPENSIIVTADMPAEMHLQVQPGDCLHWEFTASVPGVKCNVRLCANNETTEVTVNPFVIEAHGLVILTWSSTSKKKAIVTHHIVHQRQVTQTMDFHDVSPRSSSASMALPTPPLPTRVPNPRVQTTASNDYFESDPEVHHSFRGLTVPPDERTFTKELKGTVTMSENFPFRVSDFLPVAQFLSSRAEQFETLREFFEMKLPPGFPVKFHLPMMLSVRASYTFLNAGPCNVDQSHFDIPADYI